MHARELVSRLTQRGLRASDAAHVGHPVGALAVSAQRVDVQPFAGRLVVLLPGPRAKDGLYWHWQRPLPGGGIGARWFQPFLPASAYDAATDVIAAAIDADVRARARSMHIPATAATLDSAFERKFLARMGRPLHLLVYRALEVLDRAEKQVEDTDLLHQLFRIDHLATRTLRGLERLAVLGGESARQVHAPMKLATVMRQAVAQVEHYPRVRVQVPPAQVEADLPGYAGPEITLLLAELTENATQFSPPDTLVHMRAVQVPAASSAPGVSIEITDRGLPMPADTYAALNGLLAAPDTVSLRDRIVAGPIGLLVASRIAQRHGVQVTLSPAEPEGTRAVVTLPADMLMPSRPVPHHPTVVAPVTQPASPALPAPPGGEATARGGSGARVPRGADSPLASSSAAGQHAADSDGRRPALPRRRRTSSPAGSAPAVAGDGADTTTARGPVAGLLADFSGAARRLTAAEDTIGLPHAAPARPASDSGAQPPDLPGRLRAD